MNRRHMIATGAALASTALSATADTQDTAVKPPPSQRLARKYVFDDPDMDLFFMAAASWAPSGGLDLGQAYYVASQITDGDGDSWIKAFSAYGDQLMAQADVWKAKGWKREAGEVRLKAFAAYRSAWQFAPAGAPFLRLVARQKPVFVQAMQELKLPATFFEVAYAGRALPGVFLQNANPTAPVVLVIGGADTSFEDLFLSLGRNLLDRGYSVALADLPGQGMTMADGFHWETEAETPIAAISDALIQRFGAEPGRMALIGLSLGGYFVARAAAAPGAAGRWATAIASTPFPSPASLFALSALAAASADEKAPPTQAAVRARMVSLWKAGAKTPQDFIPVTAGMVADPAQVTLPFLSILGGGDSPVFATQAHDWHAKMASRRKSLVLLDAASGADGHVQVNNRLRLCQECVGWMDDIFGRSDA